MNFRRLAQKIRAAVDLDMTIVVAPEEAKVYSMSIEVETPYGRKVSSQTYWTSEYLLYSAVGPEAIEDMEARRISGEIWDLINSEEALPTPPLEAPL